MEECPHAQGLSILEVPWYDSGVKLTAQVKRLPTPEQSDTLKETLRASNAAANEISDTAWENRSFGQYKIHKLAYHSVRESSGLSSQVVIRAIAKVADAYKLDRRRKRKFKPLGAIAYDDRILRWKEEEISIWTVAGRQRIPFVCGEKTAELLRSRHGESDLLYRDGKWYLLATVNVEEPPPGTPADWIGVDLGIKNIATDSTGENYSGSQLKSLRHRYHRVHSRLQSKGTKSAKRRARKRRHKERRMARNVNHVISKRIVRKAQRTDSGIALEDLSGIRERTRVRRHQRRAMHSSWSFNQLRQFVLYKAALEGVPVVFVDPRNTSRTCPECGHVDKRNRHSRDRFRCCLCGFSGAADSIAAENIRRAAVNPPNAASDRLSVA
jgi:putative transposase